MSFTREAVALSHVAEGPADAPVLVLAPSLGTTAEMWRAPGAALAARRRVIRIDQRGHGRSEVPRGPYTIAALAGDVLALLDEAGVERCDFCGVSLGGMVGMWLAAHAPERIRALVVCASSPHMPPAEQWTERARLVREAGSTAPLAQPVVERWLTGSYASAHPGAREELEQMLLATPAEGYAGCCEAIGGMDLREDLALVQAPTLVLGGAQDPSTPPAAHAAAIAELIAGARLEILDPAAHLLPVERAADVARLVSEHLRKGVQR